jgi:hypothetical protein
MLISFLSLFISTGCGEVSPSKTAHASTLQSCAVDGSDDIVDCATDGSWLDICASTDSIEWSVDGTFHGFLNVPESPEEDGFWSVTKADGEVVEINFWGDTSGLAFLANAPPNQQVKVTIKDSGCFW